MCTGSDKAPTFSPCQNCESCQAFEHAREHEGVHTDYIRLRPENKVGYSVDQIKELRGRLSLRRSIASERIIVLEDAEALSGGSGAPANALLKILEEPRPNTRLLLLSTRPEGILPTIRSRCQIFRIPQLEELKSELDPEKLENWSALWQWIGRGAPERDWASLPLPANQDSFFKEREEALNELKAVFRESWARALPFLPQMPESSAQELLLWFEDFEECLYSLKSHGQTGLQWSAFKTRAKSIVS